VGREEKCGRGEWEKWPGSRKRSRRQGTEAVHVGRDCKGGCRKRGRACWERLEGRVCRKRGRALEQRGWDMGRVAGGLKKERLEVRKRGRSCGKRGRAYAMKGRGRGKSGREREKTS
jgi:hypothetical protein